VRSTVENLEVLYEDNHLIAVNKRSSDIVQGDKTGDQPLSEVVMHWLKKKYNKPGDAFIGVVHRIDRPVTGILLFAKTSKALSRLTAQFRDKQIQKTYWAAVCARPEPTEGKLTHYLFKDEKTNKSKALDKPQGSAKLSSLTYKLFAESTTYFFLEILPETGRHHQIRAQLGKIGCSIKGDLKYGAPRPNKDGSIHLHARRVQFTHPVSQEEITISAPLPVDPVWDSLS